MEKPPVEDSQRETQRLGNNTEKEQGRGEISNAPGESGRFREGGDGGGGNGEGEHS